MGGISRRSGFELPLDLHQVGSWVVLVLIVTSFYTLYTPLHHQNAPSIALSCVYGVLVVATLVTGTECMRTDPADPGVLAKRAGVEDAAAADGPRNFCYLCEASVQKRSKHCRRCNKCVGRFDHHCPWLNTCVGARNYRSFLSLLCSVFALSSLQLGVFIHLAVMQQSPDHVERLRDVYGLTTATYAALLGVSGLLLLVAWLLIVQLGTFHIALMKKGLTTYEFIVAQREKERARREWGPPSWWQRRKANLLSSAPCLAVCELCDDGTPRPPTPSPKDKATSKSSERYLRPAKPGSVSPVQGNPAAAQHTLTPPSSASSGAVPAEPAAAALAADEDPRAGEAIGPAGLGALEALPDAERRKARPPSGSSQRSVSEVHVVEVGEQ